MKTLISRKMKNNSWFDRQIYMEGPKTELETALVNACSSGDLEDVKKLIKMGVDIRVDHNLPVIEASKYGHLKVVEYLVDEGADIRDEEDYALYIAEYFEHHDVVEYLLSKGAKRGLSIRSASRPSDHKRMVKYLANLGAGPINIV